MTLSVDMTAKKVAPFSSSVQKALETMKTAHAVLPVPEGAGRGIKMPAKR
jgi:acyl-CoA thioester hydrolase